MARSRNLKPSFFTNDTLSECEPLARLLFAGLWTVADREGRLQDRPKKIKAEILPYDDCDCNLLLTALHNKGFILRYSADKETYIQIVNFAKHQNPHIKEHSSTIPAPDLHQSSTEQARPLTSYLNPITSNVFDTFWQAYPRKLNKGKAEKAFMLAVKKDLPEKIILGLAAYKAELAKQKTETAFIAHASTWLNGERWKDDYGNPPDKPDDGLTWKERIDKKRKEAGII